MVSNVHTSDGCVALEIVAAKRLLSIATRKAFFGDIWTSAMKPIEEQPIMKSVKLFIIIFKSARN